jgi:serine protease Do
MLRPTILLSAFLIAPPAFAQEVEVLRRSAETLRAADVARRELMRAVAPSIVSVVAYERVPDGVAYEGRWKLADESPHPQHARRTVASGIVLDDKGTVLCCRSPLTLEGDTFAPIVDVESADGARFTAELIASEPTINLAILRIKTEPGQSLADLKPARFGKARSVTIGDTVFAVGDPFGASRTFAPGIVMALPTAACYQSDLTGSFIHCSMAISPGAVGGALINPEGEVVGLLVPPPSLTPTDRPAPHAYDTFAMQIETALGVGEALQAKRTNDSPWLGFSVLAIDELERRTRDAAAFAAIVKPEHGLYIDDVFEPSPASKAGVAPGDFVLEIGGRRIASVVDFQQSLYYFSGTNVPITFFRNGETRTVVAKIERRPPEANRP